MRVRSYKYESGLNAFYYNTKASAHKRGYNFELTLEQVSELSQQVCTYCDNSPLQYYSRFPNFIYNGIDRVDNNVGYLETNVVPCCYICNKMKNVLTKDEFMEHVNKIWTRVS